MSEPSFIIKVSERTRSGTLLTSKIQTIRETLLRREFILLPSDTCYSIAALPLNKTIHDNINILLNRQKMPISLAFPNLKTVAEWVDLNVVTATLLENFTPGPITVVCKANSKLPIDFTRRVVRSTDRTVGVRISDSLIEREVAACTNYLITTVAVRDQKNNEIVQDFEQAIAIVSKGMKKIGNPKWGAVEGGEFYASHSTVVHAIDGTKQLKLIREGDIPFEKIKSVLNSLPVGAYEDWR